MHIFRLAHLDANKRGSTPRGKTLALSLSYHIQAQCAIKKVGFFVDNIPDYVYEKDKERSIKCI